MTPHLGPLAKHDVQTLGVEGKEPHVNFHLHDGLQDEESQQVGPSKLETSPCKSPTINLFDIQNDSRMIAPYPLDSTCSDIYEHLQIYTPKNQRMDTLTLWKKLTPLGINVEFQGLVKHKTSPTNVQPGKEPWLPRVPSHWRWSPVDNGSPHLCRSPLQKRVVHQQTQKPIGGNTKNLKNVCVFFDVLAGIFGETIRDSINGGLFSGYFARRSLESKASFDSPGRNHQV